MGIDYEKLQDGSLKRAIEAALAEDRDAGESAEQERCGQTTSNQKKQAEPLVAGPYRRCHSRITGFGVDRYDDDNFQGGCKQLRDAIASALGFPGDSERDGLTWEYRQKKGEIKTVIEVYDAS
jgi:hypothetical protein